MHLRCVLLATLVPFVLSPPAAAQDTFEIQVYEYETEPKGKFDLEFHLNYIGRGTLEFDGTVAPTDGQLHTTFELTYGITRDVEAAAYLAFAARPGFGWEYAGWRVRARGPLDLHDQPDRHAGSPGAWDGQRMGLRTLGTDRFFCHEEAGRLGGVLRGPRAVRELPGRTRAGAADLPGRGLGDHGEPHAQFRRRRGPDAGRERSRREDPPRIPFRRIPRRLAPTPATEGC